MNKHWEENQLYIMGIDRLGHGNTAAIVKTGKLDDPNIEIDVLFVHKESRAGKYQLTTLIRDTDANRLFYSRIDEKRVYEKGGEVLKIVFEGQT